MNVQNMYHLLWSHCHSFLNNKIRFDPNYQAMVSEKEVHKQSNATTLYAIISRLCNGAIVVENPKQMVLESFFNLLFI